MRAGERFATEPGLAARLELGGTVEQRLSSSATSSSPVRKCVLSRRCKARPACPEALLQRTMAMELSALTWNLFHGRDHPPDPALFTWRSRLLRTTERDATHAQVNRDLLAEFAAVLAAAEWDVALLQECPPRWGAPLAAR